MMQAAPTLDDLNSLNYEIAALVKAGVPLEFGLRGVAVVRGSTFAHLAERIADRLDGGMTLSAAMAEEGSAVSPIYTAVMEAGLSSGKLSEALESLATSGAMIQETRRRVWLAMLYPIICLTFAYILFSFIALSIPEHLITSVEMFAPNWQIPMLRWMQANRLYFSTYIPLAILITLSLFYWLRTGVTRTAWNFLTSFRWAIGNSLNWSQSTELLALQIEQRVPLPEALVHAADATDDTRWHRQAREVASQLKHGESFAEALKSATCLPPVMRWMMASGEKQGHLEITLRQLTDVYRRQALRRAAIVKIWGPVTMTLVFTAIVGLTYGLAFVLPLRNFLLELMKE